MWPEPEVLPDDRVHPCPIPLGRLKDVLRTLPPDEQSFRLVTEWSPSESLREYAETKVVSPLPYRVVRFDYRSGGWAWTDDKHSGFISNEALGRYTTEALSRDAHHWSPAPGEQEIESWAEVLGRPKKSRNEGAR